MPRVGKPAEGKKSKSKQVAKSVPSKKKKKSGTA